MSAKHRKTVAELYRSHGAIVLRRAQRITGSAAEAEEVLQEVFEGLLERPESLDRARSAVAWLYGATTHRCLNRIRNRKNRERLLRERFAPASETSASAEEAALVQQVLGALPKEIADAFVYYYLDQMTHAEIAEVLGCSRRQVGNLLERAHARLERLVGTDGGGHD